MMVETTWSACVRASRMESGKRMAIDWNVLRDRALEAMRHAYAPYSQFPVGAAGWTGERVVTGCNVENVSIVTRFATFR